MTETSQPEIPLPKEPIERVVAPLVRFLHVEAAGGVVLLACAGIALALANSPWSEAYLAIWKTPFGFELGSFRMVHSLKHWINDGLMGLFFFVIGLEVKRELVLGELRDLRRAALPLAAAVGGMLVPAGIYLALQLGEPAERGWGIPMATDIAFVVGCMALLGSRVPAGLRVFLLSLAIADDIGAILVIAIGYTESIEWGALALAASGVAATLGMARLGVRRIALYVVVGGVVWLGFHESGVHATLAGVIMGLITPTENRVSPQRLGEALEQVGGFLRGEGWEDESEKRKLLRRTEIAAREAISPLVRLENGLHPWTGFLIMPVFALANAGVALELASFRAAAATAVVAGLVVGKPVGILLFSALAVRLGIARLPDGVSWRHVLGGGCLAGIGFTMAIFIAGLALSGATLPAAKIGVLVGSLVSGALGFALLAGAPARR